MTVNLFQKLFGNELFLFFAENENKAWNETEIDKFDAIYSFGIGRDRFTQIEKNAEYYAFLKTGYGKKDNRGFYVDTYKLFHLIVAKAYQLFGLQYNVKLYDPFNLYKSVAGWLLFYYFEELKENARRHPDTYYQTISWGMCEEWFHLLEQEAYREAEFKSSGNEHPRYYRFYYEWYVFHELVDEWIFRFCRLVLMV